MYSGVDENQWAQAGVGRLLLKANIKHVINWVFVSERIMKGVLEISKDNQINISICYGPNENYREEDKIDSGARHLEK